VACGPAVISVVKKEAPDRAVFLDMKFHDIPATVKGALKSAVNLGVDFVTVHTEGGRALLDAVVEGSAGKVKVLGVTVLTSLSGEDMAEAGIDPRFKNLVDLVLHRARLASLSGCAGVVCSGHEANAVKQEFGADLIVVTPGIRSSQDSAGDQKRVVTPYEAILNGADYIVVGRPIRNASDPVKAAMLIAGEVGQAMKGRA
ncbi:MAG: orotidine-5'-phosphate decarboxylase, partial [Deltaproteobacteria bacterium]|nr:orotidine-5'-phosphate decarboxylase [Deltaproteobacteria bacterium]